MLRYRTCDWEEEIAVLVGDAFAFKVETLTCTQVGRVLYIARPPISMQDMCLHQGPSGSSKPATAQPWCTGLAAPADTRILVLDVLPHPVHAQKGFLGII